MKGFSGISHLHEISELWVSVRFRLRPNLKTRNRTMNNSYTKNPALQWTLPPGVSSTAITWTWGYASGGLDRHSSRLEMLQRSAMRHSEGLKEIPTAWVDSGPRLRTALLRIYCFFSCPAHSSSLSTLSFLIRGSLPKFCTPKRKKRMNCPS